MTAAILTHIDLRKVDRSTWRPLRLVPGSGAGIERWDRLSERLERLPNTAPEHVFGKWTTRNQSASDMG